MFNRYTYGNALNGEKTCIISERQCCIYRLTQKMFCSFKGPTEIEVSSVSTTFKQGHLAINLYYHLK